MRARLETWLARLGTTYWVLPSIMVGLAVLLALLTSALDRSYQQLPENLTQLLYVGGVDGARNLLSTVSGSMITVAGVTFSITIAALSQASAQLGPRLLSNFLRDRGNQFVLGTFVATFIYCLLILRTVRSFEETTFVPHISVTVAIGLTIFSVGVLIYFFHHVTQLMQADHVIATVGRELENSIDRLFPAPTDYSVYEYELRDEADIPDDFRPGAAVVSADASGYLQAVDYTSLRDVAIKADVLIRLLHHPGEFIARGSELALVYPADNLTDDLSDQINNTIVLGTQRLNVQDVEYAVNQLVQIALRALSPGINDPFTAIACLDQFSNALARLAERRIPAGYYYHENRLYLITDTFTFSGIMRAAFDQIRQASRGEVAVTIRLLEVIAIIGARTRVDAYLDTLRDQVEMIKRASDIAILEPGDRDDVNRRYRLAMQAIRDGAEPVSESTDER